MLQDSQVSGRVKEKHTTAELHPTLRRPPQEYICQLQEPDKCRPGRRVQGRTQTQQEDTGERVPTVTSL